VITNNTVMNNEFVFIGPGVEQCEHEFGTFEVKYGDGIIKHFDSLVDAFKFYFQLNEPAALWDMTKKPELLEYKDYKVKL
jgi:hypothetical protein